MSLEFDRKKKRAALLKEWLNNPVNRMRSTYEVIASEHRKLTNEIEAEEADDLVTGNFNTHLNTF